MSIIGQPRSRPEGMQKVSGRARYTADHLPPGALHAVFVGAPVAAGRIATINASAALAEKGVVHVLTAADMPRFAAVQSPPAAQTRIPMTDDRILHEGEPVAIVLAETLEAAERGARLVQVSAEAERPAVPGHGPGTPMSTESGYSDPHLDLSKGNLADGIAAAAHRLTAEYVQPARHHNPMETSATVATWEGDRLTVYDTVQHGYSAQAVVATALGVDPAGVRVICHHTGGGFGCKGYVWPHQILVPAAARAVGRPVKMSLTRAQMYAQVGHQAHMRHRVELGADAEGRLTAMRYEGVNATALTTDFLEHASKAAHGMYACPAIHTRQTVERGNITIPTAMRAPVEGPGLWALESAMDELAVQIGTDPLDIRLANYAEEDPATGRPWSSKKLREAYLEGAEMFGWRGRKALPRTDGNWRLGRGMASCTMGTFRMPSVARIRLLADGSAVIETGTHDIGSGTTTIFPQIAADALGIPMERVAIRWGDTSLPPAGPTYGSSSTIGVGAAVLAAANDAKAKLAALTNVAPGEDATAAMRRTGVEEIVAEGRFALPGGAMFEAEGGQGPHAMRTFGAIFVEVAVDPDLGLLRLRRAVGSYSVGRIMNAKTARSQMTGGIIWGWGQAALEASVHEPRYGRFLSKNLSGIAVPVNADIPSDLRIHFVDEVDEHASPIGGKGIGEIGATGVSAAVAAAVFDAIGKRVRELPITPEKLVD